MRVLEGGRVRHAGTYNASPLCLAAAAATLDVLRRDGGEVYRRLNDLGDRLIRGIREIASRLDIPVLVQGTGSMLQLYFTRLPKIRSYREAMSSDRALFSRFAHRMIMRGVFVHPDVFEHWFVSAAHSEGDVARILGATEEVLGEMKAEGAFASV
jgi:glutamate-1-semialdehyde 2,1-aminomutase